MAAYVWSGKLDAYPLSTVTWLVGSLLVRVTAQHNTYFLATTTFFITGVWLQLIDPSEKTAVAWLCVAVLVCMGAVWRLCRL